MNTNFPTPASADASSVVYDSMISAQYPGRDEFFASLSKTTALPDITELEQLWFEMQREMTETGRVARFDPSIVTESGAAELRGETGSETGDRAFQVIEAGVDFGFRADAGGEAAVACRVGVDEAGDGYFEACHRELPRGPVQPAR
jgi:hypothetical protein